MIDIRRGRRRTKAAFLAGLWEGITDMGALLISDPPRRSDAANIRSYFTAVGQDIASAMWQYEVSDVSDE